MFKKGDPPWAKDYKSHMFYIVHQVLYTISIIVTNEQINIWISFKGFWYHYPIKYQCCPYTDLLCKSTDWFLYEGTVVYTPTLSAREGGEAWISYQIFKKGREGRGWLEDLSF